MMKKDQLAETNALLKQWFQLDQEARTAHKLAMDELDEDLDKLEAETDRRIKERLAQKGPEINGEKPSESEDKQPDLSDLDKNNQQISEAWSEEFLFRERLAEELQRQAELLPKILKRLEERRP